MPKSSIFVFLTILLVFNTSCEKDPEVEEVVKPVFSITSATVDEGNDTPNELVFTIKINTSTTVDVSVFYSTSDITAAVGNDFEASSGTVTIPAGDTQKEISILTIPDDNLEDDELFEVALSNAINADVSSGSGIGVGTILNDDSATPIDDAGYSTPDSYPGMTLVWADEFDGTSLNTNSWTYETGNNGWGNNELQNYTSGTNNATVADGYLRIEARKEGSSYTSARLITQGKRSFQYGRVDIRARLPQGQGLWPALWMLGNNYSTEGWPACGEIDIMELLGHEPNKVYGTVHWDQNGHAEFGGSKTLSSGSFFDEFHVFTIRWDAQKISWYMNDQLYHEIDTTPGALSEFQQEFFFIFNVAVGGNWPGDPNPTTTFPQTMYVDYVRVFQ